MKKKEVYVAKDGVEFSTEESCLEYEKACGFSQTKKIEDLVIQELDGEMPLQFSGFWNSSFYRWYELTCEADYAILCQAYPDTKMHVVPKEYPEKICVKVSETGNGETNAYMYAFSDCVRLTKKWFARFGYTLDIQQNQQKKKTNKIKLYRPSLD